MDKCCLANMLCILLLAVFDPSFAVATLVDVLSCISICEITDSATSLATKDESSIVFVGILAVVVRVGKEEMVEWLHPALAQDF